MRDFWTFIGGVAVGILAVTGVFAMEEDEGFRSIEHDVDEMDELDDEIEEEMDGDDEAVSEAS